MSRRSVALVCVALLGFGGAWSVPGVAAAHPIEFGALELVEAVPGTVGVRFYFSGSELAPRGVSPSLEGCQRVGEGVERSVENGFERSETWRCPAGLGVVRFEGLRGRNEQIVVRYEGPDGHQTQDLVDARRPRWVRVQRASRWMTMQRYGKLGVEHLMGGLDHVLFVVLLTFLIAGRWRALLLAITAFTVGHAATLALATLGHLSLPPGPGEAAIALSLVLLARELFVRDRGTLVQRRPHVPAFLFGLVHGLGFAGALAETGLPSHAVAPALLAFNLGIELGQLVVVLVVLGGLAALRRFRSAEVMWLPRAVALAIGSVSFAWVIERVASF